LAMVALVPDRPVPPAQARSLLPPTVSHGDAAANAGRAALLTHAVTADPDLLLPATRDWLHQRQRGPVLGESYELVTALRAEGLAAVISGAGPTVLVLGRRSRLATLSGRRFGSHHASWHSVGAGVQKLAGQ
ncbi:MAG: homoserine kinase, partial [Propionibacteriales bacterium]|nr:homoserine kinase [Propionibacteriales bacterium]